MLECFHPSYTLLDRAKVNQLHNLCNYLTEMSIVSSAGAMPESQYGTDMEIDPETGINMNCSNNHEVNGTNIDSLSKQFSESTNL